jgi:hypothetical protein
VAVGTKNSLWFRIIPPMHPSLCTLPQVFALIVAPLTTLAQSPSLPPIFEKRAEPIVANSTPKVTSTLMSDRVRGLLADRVLADSGVFSVPIEAAPIGSIDATTADTVVMERFVVKSPSLRLIELPPIDTPFLRFIKTGTLYRHVGRKIETHISLNFLPVASDGYGSSQTSTRAELRFSFRW